MPPERQVNLNDEYSNDLLSNASPEIKYKCYLQLKKMIFYVEKPTPIALLGRISPIKLA